MGLFDAVAREYTYVAAVSRTLIGMRDVKPGSAHTIVDVVEAQARATPDAIAFYYLDTTMSYAALNAAADGIAHWARQTGVERGEAVALMMENRPDYVVAWLGLLKAGAVAALINTNLRGAALAHSIALSGAHHVIVGDELADPYREAEPNLEPRPTAWSDAGSGTGMRDLSSVLRSLPSRPAPRDWRDGIRCKDRAFYIYTSGTTGLPKASNFTHLRLLYMMHGFAGALNARASDRMYNVLPLYHSAGGVCALGPALLTGGSVILRRKFSVHEFWQDVHRYEATLFQYIGEICRYLLNAPTARFEHDHKLRAITGNGLRPEIWTLFQQRFAIPRIVEFYGATEGNVSMLNYDGKVGAVGRIPFYMRGLVKTRIVKFDIEREAPVRRSDGRCVECETDEVGEVIGQISAEPGRTFDGYSTKADSDKKVLRDVFEAGDSWFRTGDLMRRDRHGYFYFVDRVGDTFRWKGENVATSEVAEALSVVAGVKESIVYGVAVPETDGRAGMAALVTTSGFDIAKLAAALSQSLPSYARPVFVRLLPEIETTGTFKQRKGELVNAGFDPRKVHDPIFWFDPATAHYEALSGHVHAAIVSGQIKL